MNVPVPVDTDAHLGEGLERLGRQRGDRRAHRLREEEAARRRKGHERFGFPHEKAGPPLLVHLEDGVIAVPVPRRRRDDAVHAGLDLADPGEILEDGLFLDGELVLVAEVLQVAPAADAEDGALGLAANRRGLDDPLDAGEDNALSLAHRRAFDPVARRRVRHEDGLVLEEGESVAAVHDLLDLENHGVKVYQRAARCGTQIDCAAPREGKLSFTGVPSESILPPCASE